MKRERTVSVTALHQNTRPANAWVGCTFNNDTLSNAVQTVANCSSVITVYGKILTGLKPTARSTLVLAESEVRDYFGDMRKKRAALIAERLDAAEWLISNGVRMRKIAEYRCAAKEGSSCDRSQAASFMPLKGQAMACLIGGSDDRIADAYLVEPSARHPRYFFVSFLSDGQCSRTYSAKPVRADLVEAWLKEEGLCDPVGATWKAQACEGVYKAGQSMHAALEAA